MGQQQTAADVVGDSTRAVPPRTIKPMYDNILVPTDGSEAAEYAVEQAVDLASKYGATVHALYVVDVDATSYSLGTEQVDRIRQGHLDDMPEVKDAPTRPPATSATVPPNTASRSKSTSPPANRPALSESSSRTTTSTSS